MSLKLCVAEYMISDSHGTGMRRGWFPRIVDEAFLTSDKDGEIDRAPDPVTMIEGDLSWFNATGDAQRVTVHIKRSSRTIVAQNPATVVIHDAWSFDVGESPSAEYPTITQDVFGGRFQVDRASVARDRLQYARLFLEGDVRQTYVDLGVVEPMQAMHFRYLAAVQTPGVWTEATEFDVRNEAHARWTRLVALASPVEH